MIKLGEKTGIIFFVAILVTTLISTAQAASIYLEAENTSSIVTPMRVASSSTASNGSFIYIPAGSGTFTTRPGPGVASYTVNITEAGTYAIWGRVLAPTTGDDSFFIQVDSGIDNRWDLVRSTTWRWSKVKNILKPSLTFKLTAGTHTIKIKHREDGPKIDRLFLTTSLTLTPTDGPTAACGNKIIENTEACDDGNLVSGDGCSKTCTKEFCGDNIVQSAIGEQCEGTGTQSCTTSTGLAGKRSCQSCKYSTCTATVTAAVCGNGIVQTGEQCDDGDLVSGDGCSQTCIREFCGDAIVHSGLGEQCEGTGTQSCTTSTGATGTRSCQSCKLSTCTATAAARCGDGIIQSNEECDDSNTANGDGCSSLCLLEITQTGGLDAKGMARVKALETKLNNMTIISSHPRIFINAEKLPELRAKVGQAAWNDVILKADQGDLISSALGYLMLENSNPGQAQAYATNVYNKINGSTFTSWCASAKTDLTPRINIAMAALAFDWAYNGLTSAQRTTIINKLSAAADLDAMKKEIDDGIVPKTGESACFKRGTQGETFHREEWEFYAYDAWPMLALAGHDSNAAAVYKSLWNYRWYWGDAARAEAYVNDGTPFEGYYFGNDGVSWFLPLESATGIDLVNGPESTWNRDAAYYLLYRFDITRSSETMHKGVAKSTSSSNSYIKTVVDTWKMREHIYRSFALNAKKDPYLQWIIKNKLDRFSSWLMTNNYFNNIAALYPVSKLLFFDEKAVQKDPTTATYADLPFDRHFEGGNEAYMRTGWGPKSTIVGFRSKPAFTMTSHSDFDVNTFVIYRDGGPLAPDAGVYDTYDNQRNYFNYQKNTVAHNNLLVVDPANPDGPVKLSNSKDPGGIELRTTKTFSTPGSSTNSVFTQRVTTPNWADIKRFESTPEYAYLVADAKEAYGTRLSKYDRSLAFLREGNDNAYLIIFDRVVATDAAFKKKWLLHTITEPVLNGSIVKTEVPGHIETYNGDYMVSTNHEKTSKMHAKFLLPENHTVRSIRGETLHTVGTVSVANGSNKVTGSGTKFSQVMVGHYINVNKDKTSTMPKGFSGTYDWFQIKSVEDATHLTLVKNYTHSSASSQAYTINQGYQFWVDGTNPQNIFVTDAGKEWADNPETGRAWQHMGQGRIELMPPDGNKTDYFLVAMNLGDMASTMPPTALITTSSGEEMAGVLIENKVVMFGKSGLPVTTATFKVTHNGSVNFLIADLKPGQTYRILKGASVLLTGKASANGTLNFTDNPGTAGGTYNILMSI